MKPLSTIVLGAAFAVALAAPAAAHGGLVESRPARGSKLATPPERVTMTFGEPPTVDAALTVLDGCGRDVVAEVGVLNDKLQASLRPGEPGRWIASWRIVSAVDGHATRGRIGWRVAGLADCATATPGPTPPSVPPSAPGTRPSTFPVLALAGMTALTAAAAALIRFVSARR